MEESEEEPREEEPTEKKPTEEEQTEEEPIIDWFWYNDRCNRRNCHII